MPLCKTAPHCHSPLVQGNYYQRKVDFPIDLESPLGMIAAWTLALIFVGFVVAEYRR
jgi:hypothetical protein